MIRRKQQKTQQSPHPIIKIETDMSTGFYCTRYCCLIIIRRQWGNAAAAAARNE